MARRRQAAWVEPHIKRAQRRQNKAIKLLKAINFTPLTAKVFASVLLYNSDRADDARKKEILSTFKYILEEMK